MKKHPAGFRSITQRIVLALVLIILPFNIISVIVTIISLQNARQQMMTSVDNLLALSGQQLSGRMNAMNDFFYNLDSVYPAFRLYREQGERTADLAMAESNLASYFNMIVENDAFADVLFWQSGKYGRTYIGMSSLENDKCGRIFDCKEILKAWLETEEKGKYNLWGIVEIEGMTWLAKVYQYNDFYYGSLISLDEMEHQLKKACAYSGLEVSFSELSPGRVEQGRQTGTQPDGQPGEYPGRPSGKRLAVEKESKMGNFRMQVSVPFSQGYTNLSALQILCMGFVFLYILLIPVLIYLIHKMVLNPLARVSGAMERLKGGEQDYRLSTHPHEAEEFTAIGETFNGMADRISELRIANYEKELKRQEIELKNLQLQIRPHFLMNMFNLLYSFAQIESYQDIQKLALYLSEYFRYIFQSGKELQPFSLEINLIQKYMEIAEMRYPGCVEAVYEVDPEALETFVPPLLIHNFVENIFKHIVGYGRKIHLHIEAYTDGEETTFMIADDGPGMSRQMAEDINRGIFHKKDGERVHVGIENSYRRMKYFYGEKGSLTVVSEPGEGTCFTIVIPVESRTGAERTNDGAEREIQ